MKGLRVPPEDLAMIDPDDMVTLELVQRFGWTIIDAEAQPAHRTDWLLAIARVEDEVRAEHRAAQGGG